MKKNMKKIVTLALSVSLLTGACSTDYLDLSPTEFISKSDIDEIANTSDHLSISTLNGLYALNVQAGSGGTTQHDDFGQKGFDIFTDILSGDVNLNGNNYGWYSNIANLRDMNDFTRFTHYKPWRFYYRIIRGANNVISSYVKIDEAQLKPNDKKVFAEAKAFRSYAYYNLVTMFTKGYDANEKILPLEIEVAAVNSPAKPTKEVFDFMIKDVEEAIKLYESANISEQTNNIDYGVTKAIAAYIYAAKGDQSSLQRAAELSKSIVDNTAAYPLATKNQLLGGFNKMAANKNWMWGAVLTTDNNLDLISWWGQMDIFTYSYAFVGDTKGMNKELYESIPEKDYRKKQFVVSFNKNYPNSYLAVGKFYSAVGGKRPGGQRVVESDYVFMRTEEMHLLNAELNARLGNETQAKEVLKNFLAARFDNASDYAFIDTLSGQNLKNEILKQMRIEFWGEGKIYAAVKRNKTNFQYGTNHLTNKGEIIRYDDDKITFKVPQNEILNNPVYGN